MHTLSCGLSIAKEENIRALLVFGDSMIIIKAMVGKSTPKGSKLKNIISIIKQKISYFVRFSFFHIKKDLNEEVDHWAK
jgi:hypothetical protein